MSTLASALSQPARHRLRKLAEIAEDVEWPACMAVSEGWNVTNEAYQGQQRRLGSAEMRALVGALGLSPPFDPEGERELLLAALDLFLRTERTMAEVPSSEAGFDVEIATCPLMKRFLNPRWQGLTACGCFARRKGWYDALGAPVDEELVLCRKWGEDVCELTIRVQPYQRVRREGSHAGAGPEQIRHA